MALAIACLLGAIAIPAYRSHVAKMKTTAAEADILLMSTAIQTYSTVNNSLPPDLATVGFGDKLDPWGNPYYYLSFDNLHGHGAQRKDRNLVPINTRYDLYSAGADGETRTPLTAPQSRDDIILANDGNFIGLASDY
jgi:general secretion pathway protein G